VAGPEHGFQDILARPDLDTLVPVPWEPDTAWCLADLQRMKLCYCAAASSAPRSVFPWCD